MAATRGENGLDSLIWLSGEDGKMDKKASVASTVALLKK